MIVGFLSVAATAKRIGGLPRRFRRGDTGKGIGWESNGGEDETRLVGWRQMERRSGMETDDAKDKVTKKAREA